jgi:hypothetical protein
MNWFWILAALLIPMAVAVVLALPFWLNDAPLAGNVIGIGLIAIAAIASIVREQSDIQKALLKCAAAGKPCIVQPAPFTRFAVYGCLAMFDVAVLFVLSLWIEERRRRRLLAPEWR